MEYQIKEIESMDVVGVLSKYATMQDAQQGLPKAWEEFNQSGEDKKLLELSNHQLNGFLGVIVPTDAGMNYLIAVTSDKTAAGLHPYTIPEGKYLVADAVGPVPDALQKVCGKLYDPNFISNLGYESRNAPGIEFYPDGDPFDENYVSQVWVPIK